MTRIGEMFPSEVEELKKIEDKRVYFCFVGFG